MYSEHIAYEQHTMYLNRYTHHGITITQRIDGYWINHKAYNSLEDARMAIDRKRAFDTFFALYGSVCTRFENVMMYSTCRPKHITTAMQIVISHSLPLTITAIPGGFTVAWKREGV